MSFAKNQMNMKEPSLLQNKQKGPTMFHTNTDALPIPLLLLIYPSTNILISSTPAHPTTHASALIANGTFCDCVDLSSRCPMSPLLDIAAKLLESLIDIDVALRRDF